MDIDGYIRILLSIAAALSYAVTLLPPNPTLKASARAKLKGPLENTRDAGQGVCVGIAYSSIIVGVADVSLILTRDTPYLWLRAIVQRVFLFKGANVNPTQYLTKIQLLGAILMIAGGSLRFWLFRTLGKFYTFQVGIQNDQRLVKHGPYSVVRHPGYTSLLLATSGFVIWHFAPGSWVRDSGLLNTTLGWTIAYGVATITVSITYMVCRRPPQEDRLLKKAFGKEWDDWARDVPYRMIPGIY